MPRPECRIQADAIVVDSQRIYAPGQVVIRDGFITEVTKRVDARADVRLDGLALMPGLVNAHTHLEFSDRMAPLPAGENFADWIRSVLATRAERPQTTESVRAAIAKGLQESSDSGVVALADIASWPWQPDMLTAADNSPSSVPKSLSEHVQPEDWPLLRQHLAPRSRQPHVVALLEQLGLTAPRAEQTRAWCQNAMSTSAIHRPESLIDIGFSPHAPYSTREQLWRSVTAQAASTNALLAMHLAESPAERQWLDAGSGPMAELISTFGVSDWHPEPDYLMRIIDALAIASGALIVHGNYLSSAELDQAARYRDRFSLVYCPRTHQHFGHQAYPLAQMHKRGLRVLLATDSRATNPDLNVWQEARTALRLHPHLRPTQAFAAITHSAADALRIGDHVGSIVTNAQAAFCVLPFYNLNADPEELFGAWFEEYNHPLPCRP